MKKIIILASIVAFALSAYSQDSLSVYLELAAKNNPAVLQKLSEYQAALQKVPQSGSLPDPELSAGIFLSPMEQMSGNQLADLSLMQMFPWFGVLKNAKDEMSLMAKAKYESFREAQLQVFYNVQSVWNEMYKNQQSILISEKNLEILRTIERLSLVRFKSAPVGSSSGSSSGGASSAGSSPASSGSSGMSGMGGGGAAAPAASGSAPMASGSMASSGGSGLADLYRVQMEIGELENSVALLKNQQQAILARFNSYLNRQSQTPVTLPEKMKTDSLGISLAAVSDSMLTNNPMLGMLQYEQQSLEARKQMVTRMSYPMIGLGLNYSVFNKSPMSTSPMNGDDMIMPMVKLTLPVYRKKYKAMQQETELMKTATQQGYQATANLLESEYYQALQLYRDAQRRTTLYENQFQLATRSLNILLKSFSASGSGLTDLLRIRQQVLDYELKHVEAVTDNNTAIAWLKRLMAHSPIQ